MDTDIINIVIGYIICINILGIVLVWLKVRTNIIKISDRWLNVIHVIVSMLGGFIGTLVGAEMLRYKTDSKLFKRWIKVIVFFEISIIIYLVYRYNS